jgi:hypothetical protein
MGGWMDGWMGGCKSRNKDCLQQSKTIGGQFDLFALEMSTVVFVFLIPPSLLGM